MIARRICFWDGSFPRGKPALQYREGVACCVRDVNIRRKVSELARTHAAYAYNAPKLAPVGAIARSVLSLSNESRFIAAGLRSYRPPIVARSVLSMAEGTPL